MIYFDNAATTLQKPDCVKEAMIKALDQMGNSGRGVHEASLYAGRTIYRARESLARLLGAGEPEQVVFTANATESLNLAISGLLEPGDHVITTAWEHNSVLRPLYRQTGVELSVLPVRSGTGEERRQGLLDWKRLEETVKINTKALILAHASNLT